MLLSHALDRKGERGKVTPFAARAPHKDERPLLGSYLDLEFHGCVAAAGAS